MTTLPIVKQRGSHLRDTHATPRGSITMAYMPHNMLSTRSCLTDVYPRRNLIRYFAPSPGHHRNVHFFLIPLRQVRTVETDMEVLTANVEVLAEQMDMTIAGLMAVTGGLKGVPLLAAAVEGLASQVEEAMQALYFATFERVREESQAGGLITYDKADPAESIDCDV